MKKILISIILLSICYSSSDEGLSNAYPLRGSEYSLGISDKVGFFGFSSHSWVTRQESFDNGLCGHRVGRMAVQVILEMW